MKINEEIKREKQFIARCEKSLSLEKLKQRKADTRRKIEFGGLIIKAGLSEFDKPTLLGALDYVNELIKFNQEYLEKFKMRGEVLFIKRA